MKVARSSEKSLDRVTDFYLEAGADGLTLLGMMGEAPKMTQAESTEIARRVIARAGKVPVVVGVSAPGLAAIGELSGAVMQLGAAGVMIAPPRSLRTDRQIVAYFQQVADMIGPDLPFVLQDFPLVTDVQISDEALGWLVENTGRRGCVQGCDRQHGLAWPDRDRPCSRA